MSVLCLHAHSAWAGGFYIEVGGGISKILSGDGLFPTLTDSSGWGLGANVQFSQNFSHQLAPFQFHLGVKAKLSSASFNNQTYSMIGIYPHIRLETPRFYLGLGITPLMWTQQGSGITFTNLDSAPGLAYTAEIGLLWRVVPYFHNAIEGSVQTVSATGGFSPMPEYTISLQLRFLFPETLKGGERSNQRDKDFDGWRYPFGIAKPR